jgi:hypothetical protein
MRYSRQIDQEALARRGNAKRERAANRIVKPKGLKIVKPMRYPFG